MNILNKVSTKFVTISFREYFSVCVCVNIYIVTSTIINTSCTRLVFNLDRKCLHKMINKYIIRLFHWKNRLPKYTYTLIVGNQSPLMFPWRGNLSHHPSSSEGNRMWAAKREIKEAQVLRM